MTLTLPLEAEALVPHRLPMRMVDRLLSADGKNGVVEAWVTADGPLISADGQLEDVALVELLAQSYAAINGYCDLAENRPMQKGFLVGIKKMVKLSSAQCGDHLKIHIQTLVDIDGFAVAAGEIWRGEEQLAYGEIKVWVNA